MRTFLSKALASCKALSPAALCALGLLLLISSTLVPAASGQSRYASWQARGEDFPAEGESVVARTGAPADEGTQPPASQRAPEALRQTISLRVKGAALGEALRRIAREGELDLIYGSHPILTQKKVTLRLEDVTVREALEAALRDSGLGLVLSRSGRLILVKTGLSKVTPIGLESSPPGRELMQKAKAAALVPAAPQVQTGTIAGTVTDGGTDQPLAGVNVIISGTQQGAATDPEGAYRITDLESGTYTLQASFVGYTSGIKEGVEVTSDEITTVNFALQPATLTGEELIVTGYSTQQKRDLTGSVEVVNTEDLQSIPEAQITDQLQGMASGVNVISSGQPGEDPQIRIRGINTFGNNTPLFVVDGVPTQSIGDLDPNDIASIQILKDASAASIYGARASNGVVIIETQKGEGDITVEVNTYAGISKQPNESDPWGLLSPQGWAELRWMALQNSGVELSDPQLGSGEEPRLPDFILPSGAMEGDAGTDPSDYFLNPFFSDPSEAVGFHQIVRANKQGTDWFDKIMKTAPMTKSDITVSGGGEQGNYLVSLGYLNQQGTLLKTFLERYSLRANTSFNVTDNIRIGENLSYTVEENMLASAVGDQSITESFRMRPIVPVRDIMGNWAGVAGSGLGNGANAVAIQERTRNDQPLDKRLFGNVFFEVDFLEDFRFKTLFGGAINSGFFYDFTFPRYERGTLTNDGLSEDAWNNYNWTLTNTLNYQHTFAQDHSVTILAGAEWIKETTRFESASAQRFFSFDPDFVNLSNGSGTQSAASGVTVSSLVSQFGNVDYNYASKYFLSATLRRDGSSKFLNDRYGFFPAVSAGWRVSSEPFMRSVSWLTDLKLRAGWGVMGNQFNTTPNNAYTLYGPNSYSYSITGSNSETDQSFSKSQIGAPGAQWERDENLNVGIDLAILDGQIEATIDYYNKQIEDLLFNPELPGTAGQANAPFINVASMENTGIDASLRGQTEVGGVQIRGGLNFTSYNNEITSIAEGFDSFSEEGGRFDGQNIVRNEVGHEISSYYGFNIMGFWQNEEEIEQANAQAPDGVFQPEAAPGRFRYEDVNGDGQITADDRTFLGSANPDFTYGINLSFQYSNWDLNMSLFGSQGAEAWNNVKWFTDFFSSFNGAKSEAALNDSWTPDNRDAEAPIQELSRSFSTNLVPNSYFVEDASYLRIQNLQLGYSLPARWIEQHGAERLRLYVQASNLYTFTAYSNPDPEIGGSDPSDVTSFGIDNGRYATPRKFLAGVNLTF